ncbi:lytic murein transglycosylase [compost metagenome]
MGSLSAEQQRDRFKAVAASQRDSLLGELNRYEFGERQSYYDDVDKGQLEAAMQGAMLYANDPQQVAYYQNKAAAVMGAQAIRKGIPAELAEQQRLRVNSGILSGVTASLIKQDPYKAHTYFAQNKGQMTAEDQAKLGGMLQPIVDRQLGKDIADSLLRTGSPDFRSFWPAQRGAESGNRQFDDQGKPLTSSAGAVGVAQVMEATGPEAAKLAGLPWDRNRWLNDRDYNEALGMAYSREQFATFKDPVLALAAYNAGPGAVQKAVQTVGDPRTGAITHEQFLAALPQETQGYVAKILRNAPTPSLAAEGSDMYARGLLAAQALPEGDVKKAAIAELENYKKANDAQQRALFDRAADQLVRGGFNGIDPETLGALGAEDRAKLQKLDEDRRRGVEPKTNYQALEQLLSMPAAQLAELSLARDIRPVLDNSDFNTVRKAWQEAKKGDDTPQKVAKAEEETLSRVMNMAGILTGNSKDALSPKNIEKQQRFRAAYKARIDSALTKVKTLTLEDRQSLAEQLLMEVRLRVAKPAPVRPGLDPVEQNALAASMNYQFFGNEQPLWEVPLDKLQDFYLDEGDLEIEQIPAMDRAEIVRVLRENGQPASVPMIKAYYMNRLASFGVNIR